MNNFIKTSFWIFFIFISLSNTIVAKAASETPSKEAFIAAWEAHQKALPTTKVFEKKADGVYVFETTLFPYKGELKLLNVLIDDHIDYYEDYDINNQEMPRGVAEVELSGAPSDDMYKKYPYSFGIWKNQQFLFWNEDSGKWLNAAEWKHAEPKAAENGSCTSSSNSNKYYLDLFLTWLPLLVFLIVFFVLCGRGTKMQRTQMKKYDLSIERQLKALQVCEESLALQKEQIALLRQLVDRK